MALRWAIVCLTLFFGSVLGTVAGPASAGVGTQIAPTDNTSVSAYKVTDTSPGASARDFAGASTAQPSGSSNADGSSSTGTTSSNGSRSSASQESGSLDGSSRGGGNANDIARAREKIIDTGDKPIEEGKTAKTESKGKTFKPGLLDAISDISNVSRQKDRGAALNEKDSEAKAKSAAKEEQDDPKKKN